MDARVEQKVREFVRNGSSYYPRNHDAGKRGRAVRRAGCAHAALSGVHRDVDWPGYPSVDDPGRRYTPPFVSASRSRGQCRLGSIDQHTKTFRRLGDRPFDSYFLDCPDSADLLLRHFYLVLCQTSKDDEVDSEHTLVAGLNHGRPTH